MQSHDSLSIPLFEHKSSPHRPFCRCLRPAAFIFVVVVIPRSLSVHVVIVVSVIARVNAVMKLDLNRVNGRLKNTSLPEQVASIMPLDNNVSVNATHKK